MAKITVPVKIDNIDTEAMTPPPYITCVVYGASNNVLGFGTTAVPMVASAATTTTRSLSTYDGNVIVAVHVNAVQGGQTYSSSDETQDQVRTTNALAAAKTYKCQLAPLQPGGAFSGFYTYGGLYVVNNVNVYATSPASAMTVQGTFPAPK